MTTSPSAPLAQRAPPLVVPGNETQLHFRCKEYLASQLSSTATKRLVIAIRCSTRQRGAAVPPYWSCTEHRPALLAENWAHVHTEFSVPRIGRFDVALLGANRKLLAALEVC